VSDSAVIDSTSPGDPARHRPLADLEQGLEALSRPADAGRVALLVSRGPGGRRETPAEVVLGTDAGMPGDAWGRQARPDPAAQLAVMDSEVADLIANGQPLPLFGDNLFLDLDLSAGNLPAGSRLRVGDALLEVTPKPHNGCHTFRARFGDDALHLVSTPELRHRNLRGIYLCVVEEGVVRVGDPVEVLSRGGTISPGGGA
jgi:MOSC domain-containing protein YiiM